MSKERTFQPHHYCLFAIILVGFALRLYGAMQSVPTLLGKTLPDDAFYYFTIARNIAEGYGVTFDRLAPTNGFHPLWMAIITPLFMLAEPDRAINLSLAVAACFDVLSALMAYRVVRRLTGQVEAGVMAALLYFWNPLVWMASINGLETSVNMAMIALSVERFVALQEKDAPSIGDFLLLGTALGFAVLGRTDNVFLVGACGLTVLFLWRTHSLAWRFQRLAAMGAVIGLVTLPWFAWNLATFGSIMQVSGVSLPFLERQLFLDANDTSLLSTTTLSHTWNIILEKLKWTSVWAGYGRLIDWDGSMIPVLLMVITSVSFVLVNDKVRARLKSQVGRLGFLLLFVLLLFTYHAAVRWIYREWYILPITWTVWVLSLLVYSNVADVMAGSLMARQRLYAISGALIAVVLFLHGQDVWTGGIYPWQVGLIGQSEKINALPEGSLVGISDSGFVGYASDRQVVNLDGVVNNEATDAFMQGQLMAYLVENEIDYIFVQPRYLTPRLFGPDFYTYLKQEGFFQRVLHDEAERRAHYLLPADGRIDLGTEPAWKYLGDGWSRHEIVGEGVWADTLQTTIYVALPSEAGEEGYRLRLYGKPFAHGISEAQTVSLMVNEVLLEDTIAMETSDMQLYELTIPGDLLAEDINVIRLNFNHAVAPSEVGYNPDPRTLAVWVDYIELVSEGALTRSEP